MKMIVCHELDELAERYAAVSRVLMSYNRTGRRLAFKHFIERPDVYESWAKQKLRDWKDNERLALGRFPIVLDHTEG